MFESLCLLRLAAAHARAYARAHARAWQEENQEGRYTAATCWRSKRLSNAADLLAH